jgi:DNA-directed RNA polymerase specialized sigma24 family protein
MEIPKPPGTEPSMTLDQYRKIVELKRLKEFGSRSYADLAEELKIRPGTVINAARKGIKRYDYVLWKEENS